MQPNALPNQLFIVIYILPPKMDVSFSPAYLDAHIKLIFLLNCNLKTFASSTCPVSGQKGKKGEINFFSFLNLSWVKEI
jgi:hypothetical protein